MKRIIYFLFLSLFFIGCTTVRHFEDREPVSYNNTAMELPQNVKKIAIEKFKDTTGNTLIDQKLTLETKDAFVEDGRVAIISLNEADALLQGEIVRYILQPITFDDNYTAVEYQLWIWVDISFADLATRKILWIEKRLEAKVTYKLNDPAFDGPTTEVEAQDEAVKIIAQSIVKRTIEGWFAASGVSERK